MMGKHRRRLRWDSVERVLTYLASLAYEAAKLVDAIHKIL
jgi:hypothetical protein